MPNSKCAPSSAKAPRERKTTTGLQPRPRGENRRKPKAPLWLHPTGQWAKKIKGRYYYFGKDQDAALKEYLRVKDHLAAGRQPPPLEEETPKVTLKDACNLFLKHKDSQVQLGELSKRTYVDYRGSCRQLCDAIGRGTALEAITGSDLLKYRESLVDRVGLHRVSKEVGIARRVLSFAYQCGLIQQPIRIGEFKQPKKAAFRRQRAAQGPRLFTRQELLAILDKADTQLRAMILLGINAGFGNADCGSLPLSAVDLNTAWIDFPRPKTGIPRRCPLWPQTAGAIAEYFEHRKTPLNPRHAGLVFVTKYRSAWFEDGQRANPISAEFRKLLVELSIYRAGLSFYTLRHTFQTIADETGDYLAVKRIMGHADHSISDHYRERFPDERLRRVVEHVSAWLWGSQS